MTFGTIKSNDRRAGNYTPDGTKINSLDYVLQGNTFDPKEFSEHSFQQILPHYLKYIESQNRVRCKTLSNQILFQNDGKKLGAEMYVCIPVYIDEDIKKMLNVINYQNYKGMEIILYINDYMKEDTTENKIKNVVSSAKKYSQSLGLSTKVMSHLYDERVPIGTIRADMMDALILSLNRELKDPIIVGLDADTWKINDGYFARIYDVLSQNPSLSYVVGQRRIADGNKKDLLRLGEKLFLARRKQVEECKSPGITYGPVTSFKLKDYCKIKGYHRASNKAEDLDLGNVMRWFHAKNGDKSNDIGTHIIHKVRVDPRRAIYGLLKGSYLENMREGDFFIFDQEKQIEINKVTSLYEWDSIINRLLYNKELNQEEIYFVEMFMNNHSKGSAIGKKIKAQYQSYFVKFWNYELNNTTQYRLTIETGKFKLVKNIPSPTNK